MPIVPADTEIRIFTKNFVDSDSTFTLSHGGTAANLYDRDIDSKSTTVNCRFDYQTATVDIQFNLDSVETQMTFNSIIMINHNLKSFNVYYWNSTTSAWVKYFGITEFSGEIACYTFGAIKSSRVRIEMMTTQNPNREKHIGELIIARQRFVLPRPETFSIQHRTKATILELGDGSRHTAYTRFSTNRISKYGATFNFRMLPRSDYENLECLKNEGQPFLWYPESVTRPKEIFYVNWLGEFQAEYSFQYNGAGYNLSMNLDEV